MATLKRPSTLSIQGSGATQQGGSSGLCRRRRRARRVQVGPCAADKPGCPLSHCWRGTSSLPPRCGTQARIGGYAAAVARLAGAHGQLRSSQFRCSCMVIELRTRSRRTGPWHGSRRADGAEQGGSFFGGEEEGSGTHQTPAGMHPAGAANCRVGARFSRDLDISQARGWLQNGLKCAGAWSLTKLASLSSAS
jgi:hypothetical protein